MYSAMLIGMLTIGLPSRFDGSFHVNAYEELICIIEYPLYRCWQLKEPLIIQSLTVIPLVAHCYWQCLNSM